MSKVTIKFLDYSDEVSNVTFNMEDPSGATYDWAQLAADISTVADAIGAVSLCTQSKEQVNVDVSLGSSARPSDEHAQREAGLRVFYVDDVTQKKFHFTVPGPDNSLMASAGFDIVDWSGAEMAALETALEANVLSPDGNAISILTGKIIGRRN